MELLSQDFKITIEDASGTPKELICRWDDYGMNWIRGDYAWGTVDGFDLVRVEKMEGGVLVWKVNREQTMRLAIKRYVKNKKYCEEYVFENISPAEILVREDDIGIVFSYNDLFDRKADMLHTRCNSHVWCVGDACNIHSVKLDGQKPYLIQRATCGSFSGYGLLCDICATPNASHDRGSIVLYAREAVLQSQETMRFAFELSFSEAREPISRVGADRYSGYVGETFSLFVDWQEEIRDLCVTAEGKEIACEIDGSTARASVCFDCVGEKKIRFVINGKETLAFVNVLRPLADIVEKRVAFITQKQQYNGDDPALRGAYLIYDRERDALHCNADFPDHNAARERLSMGALVAASLSQGFDKDVAKSLKKHREFIEREILDVESGYVRNGVGSNQLRLYNFPWVSTYYLEWYRFSGELACLQIASRVLRKYYELGGANQESPCIEAYRILEYLKKEGLDEEYALLRRDFLSHADSICRRRTHSSSSEVSCANGMMNLMSTFLYQAYLLTGDQKYLEPVCELEKISESFYDLQPDYRMFGIALRYWDMYWFGKKESYGDTYPQWLSALTAQMYHYCDMALGTDHTRMIRENLLGNCSVHFSDGFAACGYLYPKRVTVFSSRPDCKGYNRPLGVWEGGRFDEYANDQDWALYYAMQYLPL